MVDLHSHLVPGVDDGAESVEQAVEAIGRLVAAGVTTIVTTPHVDASVLGRPEVFARLKSEVGSRWAEVVEVARPRFPEASFGIGHEIMLDTPQLPVDDPHARLLGGPAVLVEFPRMYLPPASDDPLHVLRSEGYLPVVAHVERYHLDGAPRDEVLDWHYAGAVFQVNHGALVGRYGAAIERSAWRLMGEGLVDVLASDHHARGTPEIEDARRLVVERGGEDAWELLTRTNPTRVLAGEAPLPVPRLAGPTEERGLFDRLLGRVLPRRRAD